MSKYKVKTIAIAVKNNRIAKFGETIDDSELTVNASELIQAGSIELIVDDAPAEKVEEAKKAKGAAEKVAETATEEK